MHLVVAVRSGAVLVRRFELGGCVHACGNGHWPGHRDAACSLSARVIAAVVGGNLNQLRSRWYGDLEGWEHMYVS